METLAAKLILSGKVGMEDVILFTVKDGELTAEVKAEPEKITDKEANGAQNATICFTVCNPVSGLV